MYSSYTLANIFFTGTTKELPNWATMGTGTWAITAARERGRATSGRPRGPGQAAALAWLAASAEAAAHACQSRVPRRPWTPKVQEALRWPRAASGQGQVVRRPQPGRRGAAAIGEARNGARGSGAETRPQAGRCGDDDGPPSARAGMAGALLSAWAGMSASVLGGKRRRGAVKSGGDEWRQPSGRGGDGRCRLPGWERALPYPAAGNDSVAPLSGWAWTGGALPDAWVGRGWMGRANAFRSPRREADEERRTDAGGRRLQMRKEERWGWESSRVL